MKQRSLHISLVFLAIMTLLGICAIGCTPASPAAPAVPPTPPAPAAPETLPVPTVPSAPPAEQQAGPPAGGTLPTVNYFAASSETVPPGSVVILVWDVSGADSLSIDNGIGKVETQGRRTVLPVATTDFVLTASNAAGSVTARMPVEVTELQSSSPNLRPGYSLPRVQMTAVVGSPLTIKLDSRTSMGYKWVVDYFDPALLSFVSGNYIELNPLTRGVDGQQQLTFMPLKGGNTKVVVSDINEQTPTKFDSTVYDINIRSH